jgi:formylglycine-generating enzyme required for sulfatase activity
MTRKLLARWEWVKDTGGSAGVLLVIALFAGCGSAPPPPPQTDPYGPRVAQCVQMPHPVSDMAEAHMVAMDAGPAVLGSTEAERAQARRDYGQGGEKLFSDEAHVRRAHLSAFRIDRTPVTIAAYRELIEACGITPPNVQTLTQAAWNALQQRLHLSHGYAQIARFLWDDHDPPPDHERHPVVLVNQDEAGLYCAWRGARLPSADEWERAARGQQGRIYPWGDGYDPFRVNTAKRATGETLPVASLPQGATPEGIFDLGGNVYERTVTPVPGRKDTFVVKGNGWDGRGGYGRGAAALAVQADARSVNLGFRCASGEVQ